jgi:hypothetical protein
MKSRRRKLARHVECKKEKRKNIEAFGEKLQNETPVSKIRPKLKKTF